eukprot:TRINITY_DN5122_c0_g1_i1.p1 TRINITY_DN5122_c0_g1~~TRINITY_DN5122_c0_g1_i1.p1  ORF type:complete len:211 (-),score=85.61 TRINITY_DN5122_c0_g1_i1:38-604(-)
MNVVLLGDKGVGKTSLAKRFASDTFTSKHVSSPDKLYHKLTDLDGIRYIPLILDTDGNLEYYLRADLDRAWSHGFLVLFSVDSRDSFSKVEEIVREIQTVNEDVRPFIIIVATKTDLTDERTVSKKEAEELAGSLGVPYFETSAKNSIGVDLPVLHMMRSIRDRYLSKGKPSPGIFIDDSFSHHCLIL